MSKLEWTAGNLKEIEQLDYLWKVIVNVGRDAEAKVFFGIMGDGYSPNYLIQRSTGEQETYSGRNHKPYSEADSFDRDHLSAKGFNISILRAALDQQSKSQEVAAKLMAEYWKENKNLFPASGVMSQYRYQIIAWSTAGTPIAKAFEKALGRSDGQ